jgi:P-type Cu+ transporter
VPIDGTVVLGSGLCNESMLTGESKPVRKNIDSKVYGGTLFTVGSVIVKVTKSGDNSAINQIMKLFENAQSQKAPIQGVADSIAKYFVPTIVLLSILTSIFWFYYVYSGIDPSLYTGK